MTPAEQRRERQWGAIGSYFKLQQGFRRYDQHAAKLGQLRKQEEWWLRIFIAILALLGLMMTVQLVRLSKSHGPSNYDKVQLLRLIDGIN